ncbi:hypothetical protein KAT95_03205 [Candidatus Parcubacteria bacterium]|nr:hypothetical protein [Candidatus Parcubacteria bacterium]
MRKDKNLAINLRKRGKSYNEIARILKVPKSTLSYWLRNIKMSPTAETKFWDRTRKKRAKSITEFNKKRAEAAREKSEKFQKIASKNINQFNKRELLLVGTALYWAEGCKKTRWALQFSNSDPVMIKLMIKFFKKICGIPKEKIRATIQIHSNVTSEKAINYWSRISGVSKTQFTKCYSRLTPSSKQKRPFNTLPYGTLRIAIYDIQVTNKVKGWIQGISKKF